MKKVKFVCALLIMLSLLSFCGCSPYSSGKPYFYGGEKITPEMLESIKAGANETTAEPIVTVETDGEGNEIVYWTKSGKVWHISQSCTSLNKSNEILSGIKEKAIEAGKERACMICGKGAE